MGISGRRETREAAVKLLFSEQFDSRKLSRDDMDAFLREFDYNIDDLDMGYIYTVVEGVQEHSEEIAGLIKNHTENWTPERMAKVDTAILKVAVYELLYMEDVPDKVSINEAVDLAKKYSHEDGGTFVNGILGGIYRSIKNP